MSSIQLLSNDPSEPRISRRSDFPQTVKKNPANHKMSRLDRIDPIINPVATNQTIQLDAVHLQKNKNKPKAHSGRRRISQEFKNKTSHKIPEVCSMFEDIIEAHSRGADTGYETMKKKRSLKERSGSRESVASTLMGQSVSRDDLRPKTPKTPKTKSTDSKQPKTPRTLKKQKSQKYCQPNSDAASITTTTSNNTSISGMSDKPKKKRRSIFKLGRTPSIRFSQSHATIQEGSGSSQNGSKTGSTRNLSLEKMPLEAYCENDSILANPVELNNNKLDTPYQPTIPVCLKYAILELHKRNLTSSKPLYQLPGNSIKVISLKESILCNDKNIKSVENTKKCLHRIKDVTVITSFIKSFLLSSLIEPLLTFEGLNSIVNLVSSGPDVTNSKSHKNNDKLTDESTATDLEANFIQNILNFDMNNGRKIREIEQILTSLPKINLDTLSFCILHLKDLEKNFDSNMLTFDKLASYWVWEENYVILQKDHETKLYF